MFPMITFVLSLLMATCGSTAADVQPDGSASGRAQQQESMEVQLLNIVPAGEAMTVLILAAGREQGLATGQRGHLECHPDEFVVDEVYAHRSRAVIRPGLKARPSKRARIFVGGIPSEPFCPATD